MADVEKLLSLTDEERNEYNAEAADLHEQGCVIASSVLCGLLATLPFVCLFFLGNSNMGGSMA